ncbi:MAG: ABC transporter permease [Streptosporangiaceae bacterium]|nr:ABC transporter permease [Streptosporangiaceae bacterium]
MPETAQAQAQANPLRLPAAVGTLPTPARRTGRKPRRNHAWYRLISPVALVGLWQAASSAGLIPASKLASPASIARTAYHLVVHDSPTYGTLQASLLASCERWAIGFALGVVIAVLLAIITGLSSTGETIIDPILQAIRSVPLLGLIPLFIVWFGIGQLPKVLFVLLAALFPMYLNTFAGIRGVDSKLGELGQVLGLRRSEMIRHIVLPGALPAALTGLQLSVIASMLALVVGEQINATSGLGFMITQAQQFFDNSVIMVALIVYAILGLLANGAVRLLERKALAWRRDFVE